MCFVCDVILCKSCATKKSRTRCKAYNFRKYTWNRRSELSDRARQEIGKIEKNSDSIESQVAEGSFTYIGDNKNINTVTRMDPSFYNDAAIVLGEQKVLKDNNVQMMIDPVFHRSLTEISEYNGVPEVVEESIIKVDNTQLNMSPALDGSLLGRIMY